MPKQGKRHATKTASRVRYWQFKLKNPSKADYKAIKDCDGTYVLDERKHPRFLEGCIKFETSVRENVVIGILKRARWEPVSRSTYNDFVEEEEAREEEMKQKEQELEIIKRVLKKIRKKKGIKISLEEIVGDSDSDDDSDSDTEEADTEKEEEADEEEEEEEIVEPFDIDDAMKHILADKWFQIRKCPIIMRRPPISSTYTIFECEHAKTVDTYKYLLHTQHIAVFYLKEHPHITFGVIDMDAEAKNYIVELEHTLNTFNIIDMENLKRNEHVIPDLSFIHREMTVAPPAYTEEEERAIHEYNTYAEKDQRQ